MAETIRATEAKPPATAEAKPPASLTWEELQALVKRAQKGDKTCLPQLREALTSGDYPNWSRRVRDSLGNPAEWLKSALGSWAAGKENLAIVEASEATMNRLRTELEGPDPTPMERLLAERAVFCWFTVNIYETLYAQSKELTIAQAEFQVRRIDSAHKRFLSAVATLARVRKLALPALQVNIGTNQLNVNRPGG